MAKATKILLALSLAGLGIGLILVTGLVSAQNAVGFYVMLPAGAICFGLFLISKMLEKETAQFDQEERERLASAERIARTRSPNPQRTGPNSSKLSQEAVLSGHTG